MVYYSAIDARAVDLVASAGRQAIYSAPSRIPMRIVALAFLLAASPAIRAVEPLFIDAARELDRRCGSGWRSEPPAAIVERSSEVVESLPVGGGIHLPDDVAVGELDFRRVADDVQVTGGVGGPLVLGGGQDGIQLRFSGLDLRVDAGVTRPTEKTRRGRLAGRPDRGPLRLLGAGPMAPVRTAAAGVSETRILDSEARPMTSLPAMFCEGAFGSSRTSALCLDLWGQCLRQADRHGLVPCR